MRGIKEERFQGEERVEVEEEAGPRPDEAEVAKGGRGQGSEEEPGEGARAVGAPSAEATARERCSGGSEPWY